MIQAVGAIGIYSDPEYLRIARALRRLGIAPSGNLDIDKAKLASAKKELEEKQESTEKFEIEEIPTETSDERAKMEEERKGATLLAEINKILLSI